MRRTFVGFGFGAIQSGLFLYEAFESHAFDRLVVAEVVPEVVAAVRRHNGYALNVATAEGIVPHQITGVEIYNPLVPADRAALVEALAQAQEIATALPSVDFYDRGQASVAALTADAIRRKLADPALPAAVFYAAENHNHAAGILDAILREKTGSAYRDRFQVLNTVIGKMSGVVTDPDQIRQDGLLPMVPDADRAFLVEAFNRILISRITLPSFQRGIAVFEEKDDLMPFEEAKLYGHNATHALLGYLAAEKGLRFMSDAAAHPELVDFCRQAFLQESGEALIRKYTGLDPLFSHDGFAAYVDDLIMRMLNPWLRDQVERITRDPQRKLGWNDRLIGTMRLALGQGIRPARYAQGALAAWHQLKRESGQRLALRSLWPDAPPAEREAILALLN